MKRADPPFAVGPSQFHVIISSRLAITFGLTMRPHRSYFAALLVLFYSLFLPVALGQLRKGVEKSTGSSRSAVPIGTRVTSDDGAFALTLQARFQAFNRRPAHPDDHFDPDVLSPKSVRFSLDGTKAYVNALEGYKTIVYDPSSFTKSAVIEHRFDSRNQDLFAKVRPFDYQFLVRPPAGNVNHFRGKPVESEFTHGGRYLWVSYYRRSFDLNALGPSAVAAIDTASDAIVRVLPAGPIPKSLAASPDGRWLAVVHWGDNTVGFVDVTSSSVADFKLSHLVKIGKQFKLNPAHISGKVDRDEECGMCLRGAVFTPDSRHLLVGAVSGGGIAVINVAERRLVGMVYGMKPTPRHLILEAASAGSEPKALFVSSSLTGYVSKLDLEGLIAHAYGGKTRYITPLHETYVGQGARTIALSPDGRWLYAAVKGEAKLVVLRAADLTIAAEISADPFPVGVAVSPQGNQVWVTSQGKDRVGGLSVQVFGIQWNRPEGRE